MHAENHLSQRSTHSQTHPPASVVDVGAGAGAGAAAGAAAGGNAASAYKPLFMYLAWHLVHSPLEVPPLYFDPKCEDNKNRQLYHGMVTALDQGVGNVTRALRNNGMLENSLIIFYADNGGPLVTTGLSGNNYPLKGGKTDDFEGGTRAVSFIFGGVVPPALRGTTNNAYIHAADWYATLCGLAGVDPTDSGAVAAGVPPIDSVDQWKTILTPNATWEDGARQEMMLAYNILNKVRAHCLFFFFYKKKRHVNEDQSNPGITVLSLSRALSPYLTSCKLPHLC